MFTGSLLHALVVWDQGQASTRSTMPAKFTSDLLCACVFVPCSYNCLSPAGLKVLKELTQLERLELRAMRPELTGGAHTAGS